MVELKINDAESLGVIVDALHKNGYSFKTFVHFGEGEIDHFTVQLDLPKTTKATKQNTAKAMGFLERLSNRGER